MKRHIGLIALAILAATAAAAPVGPPALDTVYRLYADRNFEPARVILERLSASATKPDERFAVRLELGDYHLDKSGDYGTAEEIYSRLLADFPKHKLIPDVTYRLALAQELQEKFLDAARNYEKVATRYMKSSFAEDALDAIERCFRKNYQDRVAFVDGYPVTRIELDDRISRNPAAYEPFEKKQALLDTMIDNRLLYAAALAAGTLNDPALVQNLADTRNRAMFQDWYAREVTKPSEPSEKELRAAYRRDLKKYTIPEKVHAFQILVASRDEAERIRALVAADSSLWDSLAKAHSLAPDRERGGDMGTFARGIQSKPIEAAAFGLKPGQVSRPVAVGDSFYLIRVTERQPSRVKSFDEVKDQIAADLRQQRSTSLYEEKVAALKRRASVTIDSAALDEGRDVIATIDGKPVTRAELEQRLEQIPVFFRGQFETPEGRRRILEQLILEKLLLVESERHDAWLANKVVDQLINRRTAQVIDAYKRKMTTEKVQLDSATLIADYKATIKDYREPTRYRCREMVAKTRERAGQLRNWAVAGRLPAFITGRAFLSPDSDAAEALRAALAAGANPDSVATLGGLHHSPAQLPGIPTITAGTRAVPDLGARSAASGPFVTGSFQAFAFADLSADDKLYRPDIKTITDFEQLKAFTGIEPHPATTAAPDSARLGSYAVLTEPLPASVVRSLFNLDAAGVSAPVRVPSGYLVFKVTKKDTAQKADFAEMIRRFSTSGSRWSGGEVWLTRDDQARDPKVVSAAYSLSTGSFSPVIKLNDTTFTFVKLEEKKLAYTRPFSEVRGKIESRLRREAEKQAYADLIADLRARANIEILMKESDFLTEPEPRPEPAPTPQK
ncbi:MAG: peptidyl-prolyl cis-trans isomerase [candidate division WOR-3 bacterium]